MPLVKFVTDAGDVFEVDIAVGRSVMQGAVAAGVDGIVAECGGELVCATCHVFVETPGARFAEKSELEDEMLDHTSEQRQGNSRLSCQLMVDELSDGLVVRLPRSQV